MTNMELREVLAMAFRHGRMPFIRSDFADERAWRRITRAAKRPLEFDLVDDDMDHPDPGYSAPLDIIDDPVFAGTAALDLQKAAHASAPRLAGYAIVVDARSIAEEVAQPGKSSVEYVDLTGAEVRRLRCLAGSVAMVHVNLATGNLFLDEFPTDDGVFDG